MAGKLKNVENETQTLQYLEYDKKHCKSQKMRNAHCRTWNMVKKTENHGKVETHTVGR